jgi:hypothetical protein
MFVSQAEGSLGQFTFFRQIHFGYQKLKIY